jgi:hypothetical protein
MAFLLPLASGVIILISVKPSLVTDTSTLSLCLLALVAIMPVWLLNMIVWSLIGARLVREIAKRAISWADVPKESAEWFRSVMEETPTPFSFYGATPFRDMASIITTLAAYTAGAVCYFTAQSFILVYAILIVCCTGAAICARLLVPKIVKQLKYTHIRPLWENIIADEEWRKKTIKRLDKIIQTIEARQLKKSPTDKSDST